LCMWCGVGQEVLICRIAHFEWSPELGFAIMPVYARD
jgi:hypothetical protein